jgi:hypothetical protein
LYEVKTEEFAIMGAAEPTQARIQWVIITLKKDEVQGQDQKALIADIVKAVRKEDEK